MGLLLRLLIGAETLRHVPMPKRIDHLLRKIHIAIAAFIAFVIVGIVTCIAVITYIVMQLASR